ncbi:efflux RND transporter periplasmic adaptor subunit [Alishewanella sp. BS5-314]|uniref:HlyD family secretion protein n=1 Tax=Alishewanella sp. BS5-314 TaxID=2755587 RepID=UPI0021BB07D7|nr:efflux RND transporter periplasmic adaptor subunit [Alishewanella sp. BS5-314]MCT8127152.1 efflux RND transporter periplasmic adaptor subunit [Alishewanella sp. BS5-314]
MTGNNLFRLAAVKQQANRLEGDVLIAQPLSSTVLTASLLAIVASLISFLALADFNRKETVAGYLQPNSGLAKIYAGRSGVISEVFVQDGKEVVAGAPLVLLQFPDQLAAGESLVQSLQASLLSQQQLLSERKQQLQLQFSQQQQELEQRQALQQLLLSEQLQQIHLLEQRWQLQQQRVSRLTQLAENGAISQLDLQAQQEAALQLQQQLAELSSSRQQLLANQAQLTGQLQRLPAEQQQQLSLLETEESRLQQQQLELQGRHQLLLSAPVAGRITNLIAEPGKTITGQQPLLTILPATASLEAILLVPTRAFGFVQPGQRTRLRFEAFPYQRFGIYEGEVIHTGQAILLPNELEMPVPIQEPVYRVAVALDSQEIRAYGSSVPLQSGMLLSADIVLEQRSLLSWLLEPISSLRGRL